jgi:SsrA-binding protein
MPKLADNRRALFDFQILDEFEAGLVLTGQEVKAARDGLMKLVSLTPTSASSRKPDS